MSPVALETSNRYTCLQLRNQYREKNPKITVYDPQQTIYYIDHGVAYSEEFIGHYRTVIGYIEICINISNRVPFTSVHDEPPRTPQLKRIGYMEQLHDFLLGVEANTPIIDLT